MCSISFSFFYWLFGDNEKILTEWTLDKEGGNVDAGAENHPTNEGLEDDFVPVNLVIGRSRSFNHIIIIHNQLIMAILNYLYFSIFRKYNAHIGLLKQRKYVWYTNPLRVVQSISESTNSEEAKVQHWERVQEAVLGIENSKPIKKLNIVKKTSLR